MRIIVNGGIVNIPSYHVRPGDVVGVREKSKGMEAIRSSIAGSNSANFGWIEFNRETMSGTFIQNPEREEIPENIKEQLIVELYSK